jgi:ER membrane protein complex subunit 10
VTEEITLYLSPDNEVYHISYVLRPSPARDTLVTVIPYAALPNGPDPVLQPPAIVLPEGSPPPEPEKTFIQKYWVYIIPLILILLTSGAGQEHAPE